MQPFETKIIFPTDVVGQSMLNPRFVLTPQAEFAKELVKILSQTGCPVGESSQGRQLFRAYGEAEIVERAMNISENLHASAERRGWLLETAAFDALVRETGRTGF